MKNPLTEYRQIQREIRRVFDSFTRVHCASCHMPCCRKPARISPVDILLAEAAGWKYISENISKSDEDITELIAREDASALLEGVDDQKPAPPCDFLGEKGCTFPADLHPFGCTVWICPPMYEKMDRKTLSRVKRLVHELTNCHDRLISVIHPQITDE